MAVKLNLLPSDYSVSKPLAALLKVVRPLNVTLLSVFLAGALGVAGFFIFSSITLKNLNEKNDILKNEIQAQSEAQQQIVLLKDRLGKIKRVYDIQSADKNLTLIVPYVNSLGANSTITELDVSSQKISLSAAFRTNTELTDFIHSLDSQSPFTNVTLDSFSYNPANGYLVGVSFVGKN